MSPFFPIQLEIHHIQAIVRGLYQIALADGLHQTELVMLRDFYQACQQDTQALTSFDELIGAEFSTQQLVDALDTPALKTSFLQSCFFLSYADGSFSNVEQQCITQFAQALDIDQAELAQLQEGITDHLLQQISRIENMQALQEVAADLRS